MTIRRIDPSKERIRGTVELHSNIAIGPRVKRDGTVFLANLCLRIDNVFNEFVVVVDENLLPGLGRDE